MYFHAATIRIVYVCVLRRCVVDGSVQEPSSQVMKPQNI